MIFPPRKVILINNRASEINMFALKMEIKSNNFNRLSLSSKSKKTASHKWKKKNGKRKQNPQNPASEINDCYSMCPEEKPLLKIENLSQLVMQNSINKRQLKNGNASDSNISLECNIVSNHNLDKDIIITLSSDEEVCKTVRKYPKKKRKPRKKTIVNKTPERKETIKIEQKPTTKRKLTKSTNLKTFSAKDHPDNQTKLENFFLITPNPNGITYFDTFEKSNKPKAINVETLNENVSNSVSTHFQYKKKNHNNLDSVNTEKIKCKLLNKVINTETQNTFGGKTPAMSNICNSGSESKVDSTESIVFHYNSIPSVKTESVIYSLAESTEVRRCSSRLNSQSTFTTINNSEKLTNNLRQKKVRKRLSFDISATIQNPECTGLVNTCTELPNLIISSPEQLCAISKNTNSTFSNNTSNSAFNIEQYKFNTYNYPIIIDDYESEHSNYVQLRKLPKGTSKKKKTSAIKKQNVDEKLLPDRDDKASINRRNRILHCPSYKIIEGTTFAVDGFRFGEIDGITHYFLTHFHGDHYIGLSKKFSMPIYMSKITATLVSNFIHVNQEFLHIINPNETKTINGIEVTSINANHCPGAVMFAFKLPNGKCLLHTGDFRACPEMESESYFWNNDIDTIYLDTTYLHKNYDFKSQSESITDVRYCIEEFCEKHIGQRILFVCGSYVIGKEKVWAEIANITGYSVYTNGNRRKALTAINDPDLLKYLIDNPREANIHVVTMNELNYLKLYDYYQLYSDQFDVLLAIRPSGWEKNSKPRFSGIINVVGIEYSEHSSYSELRRFCRFLQPKSIISTVPVNNNDISTTAKIPKNWFNSVAQPRQQAYQPSICSYVSTTVKKRSANIFIDDQEPTCSKYLKQNDHCSDIGMLDATKSSIDINSPTKSKLDTILKIKDFKDVKSIDRLSEPLDDWMS